MDGLTHLWWRWWSESGGSLPYLCFWRTPLDEVYLFPQPDKKVTCLVCLGTTIT